MTVDPTITEQFFEIILGENWQTEPLIIQSYDDNKDRLLADSATAKAAGKIYRSHRSATLTGRWNEIRQRAEILASDGCCIAWTVQRFTGKRKDDPAYFQGVRLLAADFDEVGSLPEFPVPPHAVIESSPNKYHAYWKATLSREAFSRLMAVLIEKYGADPNAKDICRILRLPGFPNQKIDSRKGLSAPTNGHRPHIVKIVNWHDDPEYTEEELVEAFDVERFELEKKQLSKSPLKKSYPRIIPSSVPQNMQDIRDALAFIPADERYIWLTVGMALASTGREEARLIWNDWSRKSPKYDPLDQDLRWDSFRENKERVPDESLRVGIGTLFHLARERGYSGRRKKEENWRTFLTLGGEKGDKKPTESLNNLIMIFRNHEEWTGKLWWDTVRSTPMLGGEGFSDKMCGNIAEWMGKEERISIRNPKLIERAFFAVAQDRPRDLIQEWIEALPPWDGEPRLTEWLSVTAGVGSSPLAMEISRLIPVSMVARAMIPGCPYRFIIILEGPEESGKTSLIRELGGEWYGKLEVNVDSKEANMMIQGVWVAEFPELDSMKKSEETRMKAFATHTEDEWIPKYSNYRIKLPRRTVFIGTTNESEYLKGQTGNTRYLPIKTGKQIDLELFKATKPQLFAEAKAFWEGKKETWWELSEEAEEEAKLARDERRVINDYEDPLRDWLEANRDGETSWEDIAEYFLKIQSPEKWKDKSLQMQIASALRGIGWTRKQLWKNGRKRSGWIKEVG